MIVGRSAAFSRIELRKWLFLLVAGLTASISVDAAASSSQSGKITEILYHSSGRVFINHTGTRTQPPGCATQNRWVVDSSTAAGQAMVAGLTAAYLANKNINVGGTGTCTLWGDTENIEAFVIAN